MPKKILSVFAIALTMIVFALNQACEEPEEVGKDLLPPQDNLNVEFSDSTTVHAYSYQEDSVQTDERNLVLAGSYKDNIFGPTNASFFTQMRMASTNLSFGNNPVVDSVFLRLAYFGFYGDTTKPVTLEVHEVLDNMYLDSNYFSDRKLSYSPQILGSKDNFYPQPRTLDVIGDDTIAPVVRIPINNSLAQRFFNAQGTGVFEDNVEFTDFFKGIHVKAKTNLGDGSILYFDPFSAQTKLTIYYHNDSDTLETGFYMSDFAAKYNHFSHNYDARLNTILNNRLQKQLENKDFKTPKSSLFIQSMAGINIKIKFPYLRDWAENRNIALNKATLILETDTLHNTLSNKYKEPQRLGLTKLNDEGELELITDFIVSSDIFDGYYQSNRNEYRFTITRHIQEILNGEPDNGLVVIPDQRSINAYRAALVGPQANERQLRLELIYTELDQ
jgi:hypothetical protein